MNTLSLSLQLLLVTLLFFVSSYSVESLGVKRALRVGYLVSGSMLSVMGIYLVVMVLPIFAFVAEAILMATRSL